MFNPRAATIASVSFLFLLASCGSYKGEWPKLAPQDDSDVEFQRQGQMEQAEMEADIPMPEMSDQESATRLVNLNARLTQARAAFTTTLNRYNQQKELVEAAKNKANKGRLGPSSSDWTTTQLELTRLEQVTGEIRALRSNVAQISADIAATSAQGADVTTSLQSAGRLVSQIDTLLSSADVYRREVNLSLSDTPRP